MSSQTRKKTVLITGCSAEGIGHALALAFHAAGDFHVFATARDVSKMSTLRDLENVTLLTLDVGKPADVANAVAVVRAHTGGDGTLDVLLNNAGVAQGYPILDHDIADARELFDANLWGGVALTQAFAPMLVRCGGVVANNCSLVKWLEPAWQGQLPLPEADGACTLQRRLRVNLALVTDWR